MITVINNNYLLNECGTYTLEIIGNKDTRKFYEFTVTDNGVTLNYKDKDILLDNVDINNPYTKESIDLSIYQEENQKVGNKNKNNWMLLIPGIILTTSIIVVIKMH